MANSMPFNSINRDRVYKAEDWAWYFGTFIGNGVFPKPETGLQVIAFEGMTVTVRFGYAFIDGYAFRNPMDYNITLDIADGALTRIDRVVARWDLTKRDIYIDVLKGVPSNNPTAAKITRDTEIYELVLADITVGKGVTSIKTVNITDQRFNSELCGIVTGTVKQIDASVLTAQFNAFFAEYKENILLEYEAYLQSLAEDEAAAAVALETFKNELNNWETTQQIEFAAWFENTKNQTETELTEFIEILNGWETAQKAEFNAWFEEIKKQLSEDVAGKLQLEIENLQTRADTTEDTVNQLKTIAFTGNYSDLVNKPDIPAAVAVKGNAEEDYRTGNVNITPANLGIMVVNNTADADKNVKYANSAGSAASATKATQDANGNNIVNTYQTKTGNTADNTVSFTQASARANIASGEKLSVMLGKIAKFFADLKTVAFSGSYNDLSNKPKIPAAVAVKGNTESSYRTGNVNITPENIGLGNVNNTADANKSVKYAYSAGSAVTAGNAATADNADTVDGYHASAFASASHTHSYLPLSGGTVTGAVLIKDFPLWVNNVQLLSGTTFNIGKSRFLNLLSEGIQCRNAADTAWSGISAASFTNQSSRRYKKNIKDMTDDVAKRLLDYRVVSYDYINEADGTGCLGLIAEEVAEVCEYPVVRDADGKPDKIDYTRFVPQLIKMVQIQQEDINFLKKTITEQNDTIAALLERIERLESKITTE